MNGSLKGSKQEEEMDKLILEGSRRLEKQESVRILYEYSKFLNEIGGHDDLLSFIENELIWPAALECYFGRQIYDIEDIEDFYENHKGLIDRHLGKIFMSSRSEYYLKLYLLNKKKIRDIFNVALEAVKASHAVPSETVQKWLNEAIDDIHGARRDLRAGSHKKALNRLQLAVEVLTKAYALDMGLMTEEELRPVRHVPLEVYIELLKQSWIVKMKDIFKVKKDIKSSITTLEKMKVSKKPIDDIRKEAMDWDKAIPIFVKRHEKTSKKLRKAFSRRGTRYLLGFCKGNTDVKAYYSAWFGFSGLLLPLSVATQYYSSGYVYPDVSEKMGLEYKDMNLVANLNRICYLLEENIKFLKKSSRHDKKFSYTLLCETLQYTLKDITEVYLEKEKLEMISKMAESIKSSQYIMNLIRKIQNSDIVKKEDLSSIDFQLKNNFKQP